MSTERAQRAISAPQDQLTDDDLHVLAITATELWNHINRGAVGEYLSEKQLAVLAKADRILGGEE